MFIDMPLLALASPGGFGVRLHAKMSPQGVPMELSERPLSPLAVDYMQTDACARINHRYHRQPTLPLEQLSSIHASSWQAEAIQQGIFDP